MSLAIHYDWFEKTMQCSLNWLFVKRLTSSNFDNETFWNHAVSKGKVVFLTGFKSERSQNFYGSQLGLWHWAEQFAWTSRFVVFQLTCRSNLGLVWRACCADSRTLGWLWGLFSPLEFLAWTWRNVPQSTFAQALVRKGRKPHIDKKMLFEWHENEKQRPNFSLKCMSGMGHILCPVHSRINPVSLFSACQDSQMRSLSLAFNARRRLAISASSFGCSAVGPTKLYELAQRYNWRKKNNISLFAFVPALSMRLWLCWNNADSLQVLPGPFSSECITCARPK